MSRSKNAVCGIYCWLVLGEVRYVGHARDIFNSRKSNHLDRFKNGTHIPKLQQLWDGYGEDSFQLVLLEECLVRDLLKREKYYKNLYKETVFNLNEINKTQKDIKRGLRAKRHRENCRKAQSGEKNPRCQTEIDTIIAIKYCLQKGMRNKDIAKMFGKLPNYISQIKSGYRWSEVEVPVGYEFKFEFRLDNKNEIASTGMETTSVDKINILQNDNIKEPEMAQV